MYRQCACWWHGPATECARTRPTPPPRCGLSPPGPLLVRVSQLWDLSPMLSAEKKSSKKRKAGAGTGAGAEGLLALESSAAVKAHDKDLNGLAVSPNDQLLASAGQDKTVKVPAHACGSNTSCPVFSLRVRLHPAPAFTDTCRLYVHVGCAWWLRVPAACCLLPARGGAQQSRAFFARVTHAGKRRTS